MKKTTLKKDELIEKIKNEIEAIKDDAIDYVCDFIEQYSYITTRYISDAFNEFADSNTSIYYSDQREYYYNNTDECLDAIKWNYGSLSEFMACFPDIYDLDDAICKAGMIGEYEKIYNDISTLNFCNLNPLILLHVKLLKVERRNSRT